MQACSAQEEPASTSPPAASRRQPDSPAAAASQPASPASQGRAWSASPLTLSSAPPHRAALIGFSPRAKFELQRDARTKTGLSLQAYVSLRFWPLISVHFHFAFPHSQRRGIGPQRVFLFPSPNAIDNPIMTHGKWLEHDIRNSGCISCIPHDTRVTCVSTSCDRSTTTTLLRRPSGPHAKAAKRCSSCSELPSWPIALPSRRNPSKPRFYPGRARVKSRFTRLMPVVLRDLRDGFCTDDVQHCKSREAAPAGPSTTGTGHDRDGQTAEYALWECH